MNNSIKRDFTLRERVPLNIFKITVLNMVTQMSMRYDPKEEQIPKEIVLSPTISSNVSESYK